MYKEEQSVEIKVWICVKYKTVLENTLSIYNKSFILKGIGSVQGCCVVMVHYEVGIRK